MNPRVIFFIVISFVVLCSSCNNGYEQIHENVTSKNLDSLNKQDDSIDYYKYKNPDKTISFAKSALNIYIRGNDRIGQARTLNRIGLIYESKGDFAVAFDTLTHALNLQKKIGNETGQAVAYTAFSILYKDARNYKEALDYECLACALNLKLQKEHTKDHDTESMKVDSGYHLADLINTGEIYNGLDSFSAAKKYTDSAWGLAVQMKDPASIGIAENNLGNIYLKCGTKNDLDSALKYYNNAINNLHIDKDTYCEATLGIAKASADTTVKIEYALRSFNAACATNDSSQCLYASEFLSDVYTRNPDSAHIYQAIAAKQLRMFYDAKIIQFASLSWEEERVQRDWLKRLEQEEKIETYSEILIGIIIFAIALIVFSFRRNEKRKNEEYTFLKKVKEFIMYCASELLSVLSGIFNSLKKLKETFKTKDSRRENGIKFLSAILVFLAYEVISSSIDELFVDSSSIYGAFIARILAGAILVRLHHVILHHIKFDIDNFKKNGTSHEHKE